MLRVFIWFNLLENLLELVIHVGNSAQRGKFILAETSKRVEEVQHCQGSIAQSTHYGTTLQNPKLTRHIFLTANWIREKVHHIGLFLNKQPESLWLKYLLKQDYYNKISTSGWVVLCALSAFLTSSTLFNLDSLD